MPNRLLALCLAIVAAATAITLVHLTNGKEARNAQTPSQAAQGGQFHAVPSNPTNGAASPNVVSGPEEDAT